MDDPSMGLPSRLHSSIARWRLQDADPLAGGFRSEVLACTTSSGDDVVPKLTATLEEARAEAATLPAWNRTGAAVHLLDADVEHGALLLEPIRPAPPWPSDDDPVAIEVAAELLRKLHRVAPRSFPFPTLDQMYMEGERRSREDLVYEQQTSGAPTRGVPDLQRLDATRAVAMNLLWNGARYVAIDAIPRLGDPCAEIGDFAAEPPPARAILSRAAAIASRMDRDPHRAQQWAAVWTVLLTSAVWRSNQSELEARLASDSFERLLAQ